MPLSDEVLPVLLLGARGGLWNKNSCPASHFLPGPYEKCSGIALLRKGMWSKNDHRRGRVAGMHGTLASDFEDIIWTYFLDEQWPGQML